MELDMATVEERKYEEPEESVEYEVFDMFHTDRTTVKGHISFELDENNMEEEPEVYYKMVEELVSVKCQKRGLDRIRSSDGHTFRVEHDVTKKCVNILFDEEG